MHIAGGVQCFKSVNTVEIDAQDFGEGHPEAFTEDFFVSLADRGVRTLDVMMPGIDLDLGPALAFGFAEPERGGRRELTGVRCASGSDLLTQVQKVNGLLSFKKNSNEWFRYAKQVHGQKARACEFVEFYGDLLWKRIRRILTCVISNNEFRSNNCEIHMKT